MSHVTLKELADELRMDRSNMRKYALKYGLVPFRVRTPDSRSQLTLAVSSEDAEQLRARRAKEGYAVTEDNEDAVVVSNGWGHFYVVQLIPEFAPQRVKLGFTTDIEGRMLAHRTAAPTARLVRTWPCRKVWECAAIDSITRSGCTPLSNEVFDVDAPDALVSRANQFFILMPLSME